MFYDDYYGEASEFDMQIGEFKESLRKAVKQEIQDELQRLRDENVSLQEYKKQKDKIEREHQNALRKLESEKIAFERDIKRKRLIDLLGDFSFKMWFPNQKRVEIPKCDDCDANRYVHYKTPSGKDAKEECFVCGGIKFTYEPEEIEMYKFSQSKGRYEEDYGTWKYFSRKEERDYDNFEACRNVYEGIPFEQVHRYNIVFKDMLDCQKYCDWLNNNQSK